MDSNFMENSGEKMEPTVAVGNASSAEAETGEEVSMWWPLTVMVLMTVLYSVILLTGLVGNIVTCLVIHGNRHMHTPTNYYLFSLAVSDLLLLITGMPIELVTIWHKPYIFSEVFCVLRGVTAETSTNATVLTITAFTVERYVAICHPFQATTMTKLSRAFKTVVLIWLAALACAIPQALQFGLVEDRCDLKESWMPYSFEMSTVVFFVVPMSLITVLYILIGINLRRSTGLGRRYHQPSDGNSKEATHGGSFTDNSSGYRHQRPSSPSRRLLKMLVAVVVAFFICWAPFHVQRLVYIHVVKPNEYSDFTYGVYEITTYISGILYYLSTTINPILYHIMSLKFRQAFKTMMRRSCRGCRQDGELGGAEVNLGRKRRIREERVGAIRGRRTTGTITSTNTNASTSTTNTTTTTGSLISEEQLPPTPQGCNAHASFL